MQIKCVKLAENKRYMYIRGVKGRNMYCYDINLLLIYMFSLFCPHFIVKVTKLETGEDIPYRVAAHPKGKGVICALPRSCR